MTSSIILGENNKMGKITSNFFNKYEGKINTPVNVHSQYYFRKPTFKKVKNPKYIYTHKTEKDFSSNDSEKRNNNYSCNNLHLNINNNSNNNYNYNNSLYNIYKFVIMKTINFLKKRVYQIHFQYFLYQLKIKRKIWEIKQSYKKLYDIIKKIENKKLKKYLNIYREKVLYLKAKDFLKLEKKNHVNISANNNKKNKQYLKKVINKKYLKNIQTIKKDKIQPKNSNRKNNINLIKKKDDKKELLIKILTIKQNHINEILLKYFKKWSNNLYPKYTKLNTVISSFDKIDKNQINLSLSNNNTINAENQKIKVNKKQIKIKRVNHCSNSQKDENKNHSSTSKEKKMRIVKRVSEPKEYFSLYNSYHKTLKDSFSFKKTDIILNENKMTILDKIFFVINKLESKKLLSKFFEFWKKGKK
jgi:hypothetical protein